MSEMAMANEMEFGALLQSVLRERMDQVVVPAGLEQRLKARLLQASAVEAAPQRGVVFRQLGVEQRSRAAVWFALGAHAVVLVVLFGMVARHATVTAPKQMAMIHLSAPPPPLPPSTRQMGGGGGAHDSAPAVQGRLPKVAAEQLLAPKVPPVIPPKLAVEPTVALDRNLKMAESALPNLGMPNAPSATLGGLGVGTGGGIGSGTGDGVGPGTGGGMGGGIYRIGAGVRAPVLLQQIDPEFSEEARKQKFSGNVLIGLIVDEQGNPSHVHVMRGVGLGLDEKAVEAVRQYKFRPAMKDGKPVRVELSVDVRFEIY